MLQRFRDIQPRGPYRVLIALLLIALLFGGASRADVLVSSLARIAGVIAIVWAIWTVPVQRVELGRLPVVIWAGMLAIPLFQLVPLPWSWWSALPGRDYARDVYAYIGEQPWHAISLAPEPTFYAFSALFPALGAFLLGIRLDAVGRSRVFHALLLIALVAAVLGLLQIAAGPDSGLYFYRITNADSGVGFFSNANHQGNFLASAIVILFFAVSLQVRERPQTAPAMMAALAAGLILLLLAIIATRSRAALGLALFAIAFGATMLPLKAMKVPRRVVTMAVIAGLIGGGALATLAYSGTGFGGALQMADTDSQRLELLPVFGQMALDHLPFGSGMGTFERLYRGYETLDALGFSYVNLAHNDFAQIAIEAGLPGIAVLLLFLGWWGAQGWRILAVDDSSRRTNLQHRAALACTAIIIVHSLADYPLRTAALSSFFAFCCAVMLARPALRDSNGGKPAAMRRTGPPFPAST